MYRQHISKQNSTCNFNNICTENVMYIITFVASLLSQTSSLVNQLTTNKRKPQSKASWHTQIRKFTIYYASSVYYINRLSIINKLY